MSSELSRQLTFGERAVGITFNPGKTSEVDSIKALYASVIDAVYMLRERSDNPEIKRMCSVAITEAQSSQMWTVKALTWKY